MLGFQHLEELFRKNSIFRSRFLCVILYSSFTFVNYHAFEISSLKRCGSVVTTKKLLIHCHTCFFCLHGRWAVLKLIKQK